MAREWKASKRGQLSAATCRCLSKGFKLLSPLVVPRYERWLRGYTSPTQINIQSTHARYLPGNQSNHFPTDSLPSALHVVFHRVCNLTGRLPPSNRLSSLPQPLHLSNLFSFWISGKSRIPSFNLNRTIQWSSDRFCEIYLFLKPDKASQSTRLNSEFLSLKKKIQICWIA